MSTGSEAARRRVGENGSTSPTPSTSGSPSARSSIALGSPRSARRLARTSCGELEGVITSTRWPRCASSSETRLTLWPTSVGASQANGVTCAIVKGWICRPTWPANTGPLSESRPTGTVGSLRRREAQGWIPDGSGVDLPADVAGRSGPSATMRYLTVTFSRLGFLAGCLREYLAMNASVASRASSSGRWFIGDFIR